MPEQLESAYDKPRQMRIPDSEWAPFQDAARAARPAGRSPRAAVVRQFIRWYMRRPDAKLPTRPLVGPWSQPGPRAARPDQ